MTSRSRPRVILTTAIYPPDPRVGGLRPAKLVRALVARGFDVHVVTADTSGLLDGPGAAGEHIHAVTPRTTLRERYAMSRAGAGSLASPAAAATDRAARPLSLTSDLADIVRRTVLAPFTVPDLERGIIRPMATRTRELLADGPAVVYSTAPPHSTSVAAWRAVRGRQTPWIAEFRDPWTAGGHANARRRQWLRTLINRRFERAVLRRADAFVAVSSGIGDWLHARVSAKRVLVSRNGIDDITDVPPPAAPYATVRALYAGELYLGRDPTALFDAIQALRARGELTPETFQCLLLGDVHQFRGAATARLVADRSIADLVTLSGRVAREVAIARTGTAQLLILFAQRQPLQVPNKLYEYLGSRKPILAFVDDAGETARLMRQIGGHFLVTESMSRDAVLATVRAAVEAARHGMPAGDSTMLRELGTDVQLAPVADLIEEMWRDTVG